MPAGRVLWARFRGSDWAFCITTIRFARRWESYVLNRVNKALLRSPLDGQQSLEEFAVVHEGEP